MSKNLVAGIDVGTNTTRVVVCEFPQDSKTPRVIGVGTAPTRGVRHGYIVNRHEASKSIREAIADAEKTSGVRPKEAFVSMGGISLTSEVVKSTVTIGNKTGEISHKDIDHASDASEQALIRKHPNVKVLHTFNTKYILDGEVVWGEPIGLRGKKLEVTTLFVTCLEHHFEDLYSAVTDAGMYVSDVIAAPVATSLAVLSDKQKMAGCLLADIGAETVSVAVFENNALVSLEVFSIGSSDITNDIALGFRIPLDQAEAVKRGKVNNEEFGVNKIEQIIDARLTDIFEIIEKHLVKIKRSELLPAGIVITGGGSALSTIEDFARATLKLPSKVVKIEHISNTRRKLTDPSWFVAYGLCYLGDPHLGYQSRRKGSVLSGITERLTDMFKQLLP